MANDNKLLSFILEDGKQKAQAVIDEAEKKRDEILRNASLQAESNAKEIELAAEKKAENLRNVASSNASLVSRNTVLKAKREQIDKTVEGMCEYILSLPDEDYFALIYRMAKKTPAGSGEILLNSRDKSRLPSDFIKKMAESGVNATVADETVNITGGYILRNGSIEQNYSVEAVIDDCRSEIEDYINENIFKEDI